MRETQSKALGTRARKAVIGALLSASCMALSACSKTDTAQTTQVQAAADPSQGNEGADMGNQQAGGTGAAAAAVDLDALLSKGMAYPDFRDKALAAGWTPVRSPNCKVNMLGDKAEELCAKDPQLTACQVCEELPELESCSSDAQCLMRFSHPDAVGTLHVRGSGEVKYWKEAGDDPALRVASWELVQGGPEE